MDKNFTIRGILDSISADTKLYESKIKRVKAEVELENFLSETEFMRGVSIKQAEREKLLAAKARETIELRRKVKNKKLATEQAIDNFYNECRR